MSFACLRFDAVKGAMTTALARHVDKLGHGRLALVLEGGYDLDAIEESFAEIVNALRNGGPELPAGPLREAEQRVLSRTKRAQESYWKLP